MESTKETGTIQKEYYGIKISVEASCNFVHARKTK